MDLKNYVHACARLLFACVIVLCISTFSIAQTKSDSTSSANQKSPAVKKSNVKDAVEFQSSDSLVINLKDVARPSFLVRQKFLILPENSLPVK